MSRPKDPCKVCPFARDCIAEGEEKRWCFVRILTLEAWERTEDIRRQKSEERRAIRESPLREGGGGAK